MIWCELLVWRALWMFGLRRSWRITLHLRRQNDNQSIDSFVFTVHSNPVPPQEGEKEREKKKQRENSFLSFSITLSTHIAWSLIHSLDTHEHAHTYAHTHSQPDHPSLNKVTFPDQIENKYHQYQFPQNEYKKTKQKDLITKQNHFL